MNCAVLVCQLPPQACENDVRNAFQQYAKIIHVEFVDPLLYTYSMLNTANTKTAILHLEPSSNRKVVIQQLDHSILRVADEEHVIRVFLWEDVQQENKLFIGMIPEGVTQSELQTLFSKYGDICEMVIIKRGDALSKGYGFCKYAERKSALDAIHSLHGKTILHNASASIVVKFADTPKQKQCRKGCQWQSLCAEKDRLAEDSFPTPSSSNPFSNTPFTEFTMTKPSRFAKSALLSRNSPLSSLLPMTLRWDDQFNQVTNSILSQSLQSTLWIDFNNPSTSLLSTETMLQTPYHGKPPSQMTTKEDILSGQDYERLATPICDTCIHIYNFPTNISPRDMFMKVSTFGKINDIVYICKCPYTYGRIECSNTIQAKDICYHLDNPLSIGWVLSQ